jgi:hypothetical protein
VRHLVTVLQVVVMATRYGATGSDVDAT